jgi:hypothetical protein
MLQAREREYTEELNEVQRRVEALKAQHAQEQQNLREALEAEKRAVMREHEIEKEKMRAEYAKELAMQDKEREALVLQLRNQRDILNQKLGLALDDVEQEKEKQGIDALVHVETKRTVADMDLALKALREANDSSAKTVKEQEALIASLERDLQVATDAISAAEKREVALKEHWAAVGRSVRGGH